MNQPSNHPWNCDCQYCRLARGMRFIDGRWYEEGCGPPLPKRFRVAGTGSITFNLVYAYMGQKWSGNYLHF